MSVAKLSLDELRERFATVSEEWEATNLALQSSLDNPEIDEETISDLEGRFNEQNDEITRLTSAIDREERMQAAYQDVPRRAESNGKASAGSLARVTSEPLTYRPRAEGGQHGFFADLIFANRNDFAAQARLQKHMREMAVEMYADLSTTAGAGGEFVPPAHLQERWAELARAGRPFANAIPSLGAPPNFSFTLPKLATGATTGVQATQNSAVSETDATSANVTFTVATIAGLQDLSLQSVDFSTPGLDEVLAADLASDYATKLDAQLLFGTAAGGQVQGVFTNSNINSVTYTDATPTVPELYPKISDAIQRIHTSRFMAPDAIFMHPRRWAFFLSSLDTQNRPLITPYAPANAIARFDAVAPENIVGNLQGLTVFVDSSIPTTLGAGTNEDEILVTRLADHVFYETPTPFVRVFEDIGSANLTVRIRVHGYIAYSSDRFGKAHSKITGTGFTAPTF